MDCSQEEWKPFPRYPEKYEVSTFGRIRVTFWRGRYKLRILKPQPRGEHGYLGIGLIDKSSGKQRYHFIHLVILETFVSPKPEGFQGNHINFDKKDNKLSNLEYISAKGNTQHALQNGRKKTAGKGKCLAPYEVREIRQILSTPEGWRLTNREIGERYGTSYETIRQIRWQKRWCHLN